jgi:Domain of unknown function (DUF4412)
MLSLRARVVTAVLGCSLLAPAVVSADGFEGTLKMRTLTVPVDQLKGLTRGSADTEKVYAVPMEKVLALPGAKTHDASIQVKGSKLRADTGGHDPDSYVIMDVDQGTTWMVMPARKQYIEWTKADIKELTDKMASMQKQLQERMASLPPEQRKQMEVMMKNLPGAPGSTPPKPQVRALGKTQTINGMSATAYEIRSGGETAIGWVTQDHPDVQRAFESLRAGEEKMMSRTAGHSIQAALGEKGLPVRVQKVDGNDYHVEELVGIESSPMAADLFAVPAGFQKTTPQQMSGGAGKPKSK